MGITLGDLPYQTFMNAPSNLLRLHSGFTTVSKWHQRWKWKRSASGFFRPRKLSRMISGHATGNFTLQRRVIRREAVVDRPEGMTRSEIHAAAGLLTGSLFLGQFFVQSLPGQTIEVRIRRRGKKALSIKLVVQDSHNGNHGRRDQNSQHSESGHT